MQKIYIMFYSTKKGSIFSYQIVHNVKCIFIFFDHFIIWFNLSIFNWIFDAIKNSSCFHKFMTFFRINWCPPQNVVICYFFQILIKYMFQSSNQTAKLKKIFCTHVFTFNWNKLHLAHAHPFPVSFKGHLVCLGNVWPSCIVYILIF